MWFDARVRLTFLIACMLLFAALLLPQALYAADGKTPGVALPKGERVLDLAWADNGNLTLVVTAGDGYALRRLELKSAELSVLAVPKSIGQLRHGKKGFTDPQLYLAPAGNALAVLVPSPDPLKMSDLGVYRITQSGLEPVTSHSIPAGFYVDHLAWESSGQELYLSSRPYLSPEQPYSIGRLDVQSGRFVGVTLKGNVDLVDELVCLPGKQLLAVRCGGYRGEYPDEKLIALLDLSNAAASVLHSRADGLELFALADGQLLVCRPAQADAAGDPPPAGADDGPWILNEESLQLEPARLSLVSSPETLAATPDGAWYGFLASGSALGAEEGKDQLYLGLQQTATGRTLATALPSSRFAFSPNGALVCAVDTSGKAVYFFQLPQS